VNEEILKESNQFDDKEEKENEKEEEDEKIELLEDIAENLD